MYHIDKHSRLDLTQSQYTIPNGPFLAATPFYIECFYCQSDVSRPTVEVHISLKYIKTFDEAVGKFSKLLVEYFLCFILLFAGC